MNRLWVFKSLIWSNCGSEGAGPPPLQLLRARLVKNLAEPPGRASE
jgi:hypothetical protein